MTEIDYVIPEIIIEKEGFLDFKELYSLMKSFLLKNRYNFTEKEHHIKETSNKIELKWEAYKPVDDYTRFYIEVSIKGSDLKEINLKKFKGFSGSFKIKFESYLEKDYEDIFENRPIAKFFRTLYDRFIIKSKFDQYSNELKDETYLIYNETKAFLNMKKFE